GPPQRLQPISYDRYHQLWEVLHSSAVYCECVVVVMDIEVTDEVRNVGDRALGVAGGCAREALQLKTAVQSTLNISLCRRAGVVERNLLADATRSQLALANDDRV